VIAGVLPIAGLTSEQQFSVEPLERCLTAQAQVIELKHFPNWRKPSHHLDSPESRQDVHWVELFFDLVHVVAIFLLGSFLASHLDLQGFLVFAGLFVAIFFAWADCSVYNSIYVSLDVVHRMIMAVQTITMMVMATAIPEILDGGWIYFALAYACNRTLTAMMYLRARQVGAESTSFASEQGRNFLILAGVFAVSAFLPAPYSYSLFAIGILLIQLQYMLPRFGTLRHERFMPRLHHVAERFGQFMLILFGEGFFKLVVTLTQRGLTDVGIETLVNFVMGGLSLFALAWIYFDCVGNAEPKSQRRSLMVAYWLGHLVIMLSTIMISVALAGEVYVGFMEPYPAGYGLVGTTGLLVFLSSLWLLKQLVDGRDTTARYHSASVRLFGIGVAVLMIAVYRFVPAIIGNLLWAIALYSQLLVPLYRASRHQP
jgi:low temperature requirement protein LtrA